MHDYLKNTLVEQYGLNITSEYDDHKTYQIEAENKLIVAFISSPFDKILKWQVRFSTVAAFDRWSNSSAVWKEFDTEANVINYLKKEMFEIYVELLKYLSDEYKELWNLLDEMEAEEYKK
jgi:hypothetical protein|nr:MAG TPA: hypothetical protein [Caudoviricetes sp.]